MACADSFFCVFFSFCHKQCIGTAVQHILIYIYMCIYMDIVIDIYFFFQKDFYKRILLLNKRDSRIYRNVFCSSQRMSIFEF